MAVVAGELAGVGLVFELLAQLDHPRWLETRYPLHSRCWNVRRVAPVRGECP